MKKKLLLIILFLTTIYTFSKDNRDVISSVIKKLEKESTKITFESHNNTYSKKKIKGTIIIKYNKFQLNTEDISAWYNGKLLWTLQNNSNEINLSIPSEEELNIINPLRIFALYKKAYKIEVNKLNVKGQLLNKTTILFKSSSPIIKSVLLSDSKNNIKQLIVIFKNKKIANFDIVSQQNNLKVADSFFSVNNKDFPNKSIIDLR